MRNVIRAFAFVVIGMAVISSTLSATPIVGTFASGSTITSRIYPTQLDFYPLGGGVGSMPLSAGTGYFAGLAGSMNVLDMANAVMPAGQPLNVSNYMSGFAGPFSGLNFRLEWIAPATLNPGPALGPNPSPFNFAEVGGQTTVFFDVSGIVTNTNGDIGAWTGRFSSSTTQTKQSILDTITSQGFIDLTVSGAFESSAIPEPGTTSLMLLGGALMLGGNLLRRFRK